MKIGTFTRLFVAALALLGAVTSLTGCGGGGSDSGSPDVFASPDAAFVSPVTRQYEGTWYGFHYSGSDGVAVAQMDLVVTPDGKVTGALTYPASPHGFEQQLDAKMTGDNSFTGTLTQNSSTTAVDSSFPGTLTRNSSQTQGADQAQSDSRKYDISGTLRLENGMLVGEYYRGDAPPYHVTPFRLEKN